MGLRRNDVSRYLLHFLALLSELFTALVFSAFSKDEEAMKRSGSCLEIDLTWRDG